MKRYFVLFIFSAVLIAACKEQTAGKIIPAVNTINHTWLDSIINASDSSYSKPYRRTDFVTAFFYVNTGDSSVCQVMKDSTGMIRQVIIARKNIRQYFAQYYANGQLQADLLLDEFGQFNGPAIYYYEDGTKESEGQYVHGLKKGEWKEYDEKGKMIAAKKYNDDGQVEASTAK